jgi:hypothetical protein
LWHVERLQLQSIKMKGRKNDFLSLDRSCRVEFSFRALFWRYTGFELISKRHIWVNLHTCQSDQNLIRGLGYMESLDLQAIDILPQSIHMHFAWLDYSNITKSEPGLVEEFINIHRISINIPS